MSDLDELKAEWFEFGRKAGKIEEQARIIKQLEDAKIPCECGDNCGYFDLGYDEAIRIIKGGNECQN